MTAIDRAGAFLADALRDGPVEVKTLESAAEAQGIKMPTLLRAKVRLGVVSTKSGGIWRWALKEHSLQDDQTENQDDQTKMVKTGQGDHSGKQGDQIKVIKSAHLERPSDVSPTTTAVWVETALVERALVAAKEQGQPVSEWVSGALESALILTSGPFRSKTSASLRRTPNEVSASDCKHPVTRCIGDQCMACGGKLAAKK